MSRFRVPSQGRSTLTQVVYDPASYVAAVKETLAEKSGLPAEQRRLIFTPCAQPSSEAVETAPQDHSAEDVLPELHSWQAILFQNGRALGRLVAPQLQVTPIAAAQPLGSGPEANGAGYTACTQAAGTPGNEVRANDNASAAATTSKPDGESAAHSNDTLLEVHQLVFDRWQPAWTDFKRSQHSVVLHIPVNSTWRAATYRLQVIGKARHTGSFVLPGVYEIPGDRSMAAISLHQQRCEYVRAHQRRRASLGGQEAAAVLLDKDTDLRFDCGSELNGLTAVFQVSDSPAWLKAIVLKFALVARIAKASSLSSAVHMLPLPAAAADSRTPRSAAQASASERGGQRSQGSGSSGGRGGGGGGDGDPDDAGSDGEGGDSSRAGGNGIGGAGGSDGDGDGHGRRNLHPHWDGRGKRSGNRKQDQEDAAEAGDAAAAAASDGNRAGGAAASSAAANGLSRRGAATPSVDGQEARAAASRALSGALEVAATAAGTDPSPARPQTRKAAPRPAPHLSRQTSEPPQRAMMNGHAGPAMPPGRLTAEVRQLQQQPGLAQQDDQADCWADSPAMVPTQPYDELASPVDGARHSSAPAPRPTHDEGAESRHQTPPRAQSGAGPGTPVRQRASRPAPALYVPPQLRRSTLQGAQQAASQPDPAEGSTAPDKGPCSAAAAATGAAASPASSRRHSEPATSSGGAAAVSRPVDAPVASGAAAVDDPAAAAADGKAAGRRQQQLEAATPAAQRQSDQRQTAQAATADKLQQTEGPDSLSASALESHRQSFIASASAGTAFSSLAEQPLQSDSSQTPDSSSEPSYWSAEENSPSAASNGSLARAAAADRAGPPPQLRGSRSGSRDAAVQQPPAAERASSRRSSQAALPDLLPATHAEGPEAVSPFQLQQHLAQQLLQQQQAGLFPAEVPLQPPQTPPWRGPPQEDDADQSSPPLQPPPLSPVQQPSGSATRSAPQTPVRLQRPPGLAGFLQSEGLSAGPVPQRPPPLDVPHPQHTAMSLGMHAGAPVGARAAVPFRRQVQRPPPLELPALNGRSLSPDGTLRQRSESPPLDSAPQPASSVDQQQQQQQQQQRALPKAPAVLLATGAREQLQHSVSPPAARLAPPAAAAAPGDRDTPQQHQRQRQQVLLSTQPQQAHTPVSPQQRPSPPQGFAAGSAVEAPHARTPEARRELAASRDAAAAAAAAHAVPVAAVAVPPGALPGTPLPAHDKVQPHDRALLAAAAAQASPSLPRAYERSLSSTSLHGMMLPPGLQQQLRLLTQAPPPAPPCTPTPIGDAAAAAAAVGQPAASEPPVQVEPRPNSRDMQQALPPDQEGHRRTVSAGPAPLAPSPPPPPPAATDIERLLASVTPVLSEPPGPAAKPLTLGDLWAFYTEASVYGQEVFTCGGARGPAHAYFVPLLSGLQLFASVQMADVPDPPPAGGERLYACDQAARRGGSKHMRLLAQHSVGENPYSRAPLHAAMAGLAARPDAGGRLLFDQPLAELHPASWFAVAWYPVYRIPDAPLTARFLTFHSLALQQLPPLPPQEAPHAGGLEPRLWYAPVQGLMWDNMQGERWFERLADTTGAGAAPDAPAARLQRHVTDWEVNMMRGMARALARGTGLHVQGQHGWRACSKDDFEHGDFEFFNRRMAVVQ